MGKPRLPNQKKAYKELSKRLAGYMMRVRNIYDRLNEKAAMLVESVGYEGLAEFSFNDYPEIEREVKLLLSQFVGEMQTLIYSGTSSEWKSSNTFQDAVADKALKYYRAQIHGDKFKHYYRDNSDQLKAFLQRKENGLNLSSKLWNQSKNYKEALEATISTAIEKGMSAVTLSKRLSKYLNDWPSLQADYQERYGKATNIYDCEYRSLRLARNEISMAYRSAEQARWQQFDFILGYKIKLSDSHPRYDICDDLAGDYPKDFKFRGWHPNCLCYTVPIVMSEDEYWSENRENSPNMVTAPPENFGKWVSENSERIDEARSRGTLPYWVMDNREFVKLSALTYKESLKPSPFIMTDETVNKLAARNINISRVEIYNESTISGFDIDRFDSFMENVGDENKIFWKSKRITIFPNGNANLTYDGEYIDSKGNKQNPYLSRMFRMEDDKKVVYHDVFNLPSELQGKGLSKSVFRELFKSYESMGIDRVEVLANMDVGGYCWGRYGFSAKTSEIKDLVQRRFSEGVISQNDFEYVSEILKMSGPNIRMNEIANLKCGKALLLSNKVKWRGFIDLHDKYQMKHLHYYIGLRK
jgi:hypothetical protein|nr:MAG TPA: minor capsid protein [Caudoviricetes sp.]